MTAQRSRSSRAARERRCGKSSIVVSIAMTLLFCASGNAAVAVLQPVVTLLFQLKCQLFAAFFDDPAGRENMYEIRSDVVEQTLVVRHQNHGLVRIVKFIDAFS